MQRVTITLDDDLMEQLDAVIEQRGYQNRSEAIRDLARAGLREAVEESRTRGNCVAALVYIYDHHARNLPRRLTHSFHDHHDLSQATLHVHLDEERCLEVAVLRGKTDAVRHFADHLIAERGVYFGRTILVPREMTQGKRPHKH